jgi:hypothetical protein
VLKFEKKIRRQKVNIQLNHVHLYFNSLQIFMKFTWINYSDNIGFIIIIIIINVFFLYCYAVSVIGHMAVVSPHL